MATDQTPTLSDNFNETAPNLSATGAPGQKSTREPRRLRFDQLTEDQQGIMQLFMLFLLLFKDNHDLDETFADILDTDVDSLNNFRNDVVSRGLTGFDAAREYNYSENTNFAGAATFNGSLLDVIKKHESNGGDYNILNGGGHKPLTQMSIREVLAEQGNWKNWPNGASSAVGAYQIINKTLKAAVSEMGLDMNAKFDQGMQDRIALHLLEKRGLNKFLSDDINEGEFMSNLAHEWASLPENFNGKAAYGGTANNPAKVPMERVRELVGAIREAKTDFANGETKLAAISGDGPAADVATATKASPLGSAFTPIGNA